MPFGGLGVVSHWTDKENETIEQEYKAEKTQITPINIDLGYSYCFKKMELKVQTKILKYFV